MLGSRVSYITVSSFQFFLIIEILLPLGDLHTFLIDQSKPMNWPLRIKIAMDIAKGMEFLHNSTPPVVHRDLKSPVCHLQFIPFANIN